MPGCIVNGRRVSIKGILFDKDGTLLDFVGLWGTWALTVTGLLEQAVLQAGGKLTVDRGKVLGLILDNGGAVVDYDVEGPLAMATEAETTAVLAWQLYAAGVPWNEAMRQVRLLLDSAMETVRQQRSAKPVPQLEPLLARCRELGLRLGVVTADRTSEASAHLEWMGLGAYFASIVGTDLVPLGKPDPSMALLACAELGLRPEEVLVIGDSNADMQMGKRAGAALTVGYAPGGKMEHLLDADEIIRSYDELKLTMN